jgi:drug/metabolite transporter (DMT)-like permease
MTSTYVMLTFAALFWGGTWVTGKLAVAAIPPMTLAAARFTVATILLWGWARTKGAPGRRLVAADLPLVLAMGLTAIAVYNVLFLYGLLLAPASDGAIIVPGLAPILTVVLAWPVLRERVSRWGAAGLITALAGLLLVMRPGGGQDPSRLLGDLLFFLGAFCWAIYSVIGKAATARFTPLRATLYGSVAGTMMLLPFAIVERGWTPLAASPPSAWLSVLYLAVFGTVLAFVFFYEGVSRVGAGRAASFAFLVPIFGVASSVVILGEDLAASTIAGGALVLLGLWLVQREPASIVEPIRGQESPGIR